MDLDFMVLGSLSKMLIKVFVLPFIACLFVSSCCLSAVNDRPIIGIVTAELNSSIAPNATSYMMASYVKHLEASGARVVPIMIRQPVKYYEDLMSKINGVLFPGGGANLQGDGYGRTGKLIFDIAVKMNDNGDYFPLWGTCLGFELINFLAVKDNWMKLCSAEDLPSNINFVEGYENSTMFKNLDSSLKNIMETQNVTINYHKWCLTPENYSLSQLDKFFRVLATDKDSEGVTYVSIVEGYKYPFYGVAFHPEKVPFEWILSKTHHNIPHSSQAVRVSQYFSHFFVDEARKSAHHFPSKKAEDKFLIYNYNPIFTGKRNCAVEQTYYFN